MAATRDRIFISYSSLDEAVFREVEQKLLDRGLGPRLDHDRRNRPSDRWDERIQGMMDRAAVAVLILSDHYFRRREAGGEYILEKELPYFLEHYRQREMDLLLLYWSPSAYFEPDKPDPVKPFEYEWQGRPRSRELHEIQAVSRDRLALAGEQERLDVLLALAREAERRLNERLASPGTGADTAVSSARHALTIELSIDAGGVRRVVKAGG
jgi:hypothetical protein